MSREYKSGINRLKNRRVTLEQRRRMDERYFSYNGKVPAEKNYSEDTRERMEIQKRLRGMAEEGKGKEEIVSTLIKEFPESKLRDFFESYAQHHLDRKKPKQKCSGDGRDEI